MFWKKGADCYSKESNCTSHLNHIQNFTLLGFLDREVIDYTQEPTVNHFGCVYLCVSVFHGRYIYGQVHVEEMLIIPHSVLLGL